MTEGGVGDEALVREQIDFYRRATPHEAAGPSSKGASARSAGGQP